METYGEALYNLKRRFLIIGLTGYTGSGCSTSARILNTNDKPVLPDIDIINNPPDIREYERLKQTWDTLPWKKFVNIDVSRLIFILVLHRTLQHDFTDGPLAEASKLRLPFTDELKGIELLVDREIDVTKSEVASQVVNSYEKCRSLYATFKNKASPNLAAFIELMQNFGDEIRKYGQVSPEADLKPHPQNMFCLPDMIRRLMRAYMTANNMYNFTIDAFRNPYEVEYFKRRYTEFYLVSLQRPSFERQQALKELGPESVGKIEKREKGELVKDKRRDNIHEWVTSQNVNECLEKGDYFIRNPFDEEKKYYHLIFHLIRLISLAQCPGCIPPDDDERCMQIAMSTRHNSGCLSRRVGAVVTNSEGYVLGVGWNDPPAGQVPCALRTAEELTGVSDKTAFSEYERSSEFTEHIRTQNLGSHPFCFREEYGTLTGEKLAEFTRALHAEENALLQAARHGTEALKKSKLYTTASPCTLCAKKAYHLGVDRIVYIEEYPGIATDQTLLVGDRHIIINQFEGVTGSAYFRAFSYLMPEKDYIKLYL